MCTVLISESSAHVDERLVERLLDLYEARALVVVGRAAVDGAGQRAAAAARHVARVPRCERERRLSVFLLSNSLTIHHLITAHKVCARFWSRIQLCW